MFSMCYHEVLNIFTQVSNGFSPCSQYAEEFLEFDVFNVFLNMFLKLLMQSLRSSQ
jgi:hypothetical protein